MSLVPTRILVLLALTVNLTAQSPAKADFNFPFETIWKSTIDAIAETKLEVQSSDKSSGVIWLKTVRGAGQPGEPGAKELINRYTTKKARSFGGVSNWEQMSISGSVTVTELPGQSVNVACHFVFSGYYNGGPFKHGWEALDSNGTLERQVFERIKNIAKSSTPSGITLSAEHALNSVRKVDASFKMDAAPETITAALIDAQVQLDQLSQDNPSVLDSSFGAHLNTSLSWFKKARDAAGQQREEALRRARQELKLALEGSSSDAQTSHNESQQPR